MCFFPPFRLQLLIPCVDIKLLIKRYGIQFILSRHNKTLSNLKGLRLDFYHSCHLEPWTVPSPTCYQAFLAKTMICLCHCTFWAIHSAFAKHMCQVQHRNDWQVTSLSYCRLQLSFTQLGMGRSPSLLFQMVDWSTYSNVDLIVGNRHLTIQTAGWGDFLGQICLSVSNSNCLSRNRRVGGGGVSFVISTYCGKLLPLQWFHWIKP